MNLYTTVSMLITDLPLDIKFEVMAKIPKPGIMARMLTFYTLKVFLEAIPSMIPVLNAHFVGITKELLESSWATDLYLYLYVILVVYYSK